MRLPLADAFYVHQRRKLFTALTIFSLLLYFTLSVFSEDLRPITSDRPSVGSKSPAGVEVSDQSKAALVSQAGDALKRQDYAAVLNLADTCIFRFPQDADGYALRGGALFRLRRWSEAAEALKKAVLYDKQYREAWSLLAQSQARLGQWESASASFLQATILLPEDAIVWLGFAESLAVQKRYVEAAIALERAAKLDRSNEVEIIDCAFAVRVEAKRIEIVEAGTVAMRVSVSEQLTKNQELIFAFLKAEALPESAAKDLEARGLDSFSVQWWEDCVFKLLRSPLKRITLRLYLKERERLLGRETQRRR